VDPAQMPVVAADAPQELPNTQLSSAPAEPTVPSLWTRQKGVDWPVCPSGNSKSEETGILTKWPASGLKVVWHKKLGTSYGAPTISRGRLFQFDRFGDRARLYCLNAETGAPLWQREYATDYEDMYGYNNGPRCSPVVDGDRVYAFGVDGMLLCCRVSDGELLWKVDTAKDFGVVQNFFGVGSTPVVEGELLIVMVGGSPPESQSVGRGALDRVLPNGSGIVAFDKMTGAVKYKLADELASYASLKLATIGERRWCFAFCRGGLVGFEPASGKADFHYPWRDKGLESVNASVPVVAGDQVFISETYGPGSSLLKVAPGRPLEVVWCDDLRRREKAMQTHWNTPVYLDGYLYGSSGRHEYNAELRCIEWQTGRVLWSEPGMDRTSLLFIDGHFLCLGEMGKLWLLKATPRKYEEVAMVDYSDPALGQRLTGEDRPLLIPPCWAAPVVSHGLLYIRGNDRLVCLELIPER
jgi:outer membrane protein assembly factor BamB